MNEQELKSAFAAELLKTPNDPFKAALAVFGADTGRALRAAHEWAKDPEVMAEQARLKGELGEMAFLPDKSELARVIWERMQGTTYANGSTIPTTAEEFAKLAKLYAEVRGYIEKPTTNINNNVITANKVMVVKDHGDNDTWAKRLREQQKGLTSATTH